MCLVLLSVWWMTFMAQAVHLEDAHAKAQLRIQALQLAVQTEPTTPTSPDLVVVNSQDASPLAIAVPSHPDIAIDISPQRLEALNSTLSRRKFMVYGEGLLSIFLLGVCVMMLYRLVTVQNAIQREMELFVGQMTHEMKTPLAGIKALLQTLQRGRVPDEEMDSVIAMGLQQVEREEHLVQTLLHAQRLRLAGPDLKREPIPLTDILDSFVAHRRLSRPADPGRYVVDHDEPVIGLGDREAIWTILENLADNADKYGAHRITLKAWTDNGRAYLACIDDGQGFSKERGKDIFEAYRHGSDARTRDNHGTGLGLYISRRMARSMSGDLSGTSPGEGLGATFVLNLSQGIS